jgi:hypothetical protein
MGSRFDTVFVPLFRGHLVKYNYILIFYNTDPMSADQIEENKENTEDTPIGEVANVAETDVSPPPAVKDNKTCVEPMGKTAPTADGEYVMFDGDKYKVFTIKDGAGLPENIGADAQFFRVVSKPMAGGRRKKQHKSAKKQRKSAKKQRKSRSSRRSKK